MQTLMDDRELENRIRSSFEMQPSDELRRRVMAAAPQRSPMFSRFRLAPLALGLLAAALVWGDANAQNRRIEQVLCAGNPALSIQIDLAEWSRRSAGAFASGAAVVPSCVLGRYEYEEA